jgi:predicted transcriptional regulator of viral defense system
MVSKAKLAELIRGIYPERLTLAGHRLAELLEVNGKPVLTQFDFFRIIWRMYLTSSGKKLYLRHETPTQEDGNRLRLNLKKSGFIGADRDYGFRIIRVLAISDLPAEDIACLVDPTCYVSHLSAMQRWGLTDRSPEALILTRPDRKTATEQLAAYMESLLAENEENPFPLKIITHPARVRKRPVHVYESKTAGTFLNVRGSDVRLSTIGQTFLDMLQKPDLCGGMDHILDVWEEHAATYLSDIVVAVDTATSGLVKSRAGYILEERLGLKHPSIEQWKALGQRGSSRKLDPSKAFAPTFSETWMISLNV